MTARVRFDQPRAGVDQAQRLGDLTVWFPRSAGVPWKRQLLFNPPLRRAADSLCRSVGREWAKVRAEPSDRRLDVVRLVGADAHGRPVLLASIVDGDDARLDAARTSGANHVLADLLNAALDDLNEDEWAPRVRPLPQAEADPETAPEKEAAA